MVGIGTFRVLLELESTLSLLRGSCHFSIAPLYRFVEGSGCPLNAVYRRISELSTRNQFEFTIKILVYTIEFSTTQVFIPSTASFSLMVVLDVCVLFSRNSCGKCIFILYICFHDYLENLLCTIVDIFF